MLQNISALDLGHYNRTQNVLNVQPALPVRISQNLDFDQPHHSANRLAAIKARVAESIVGC